MQIEASWPAGVAVPMSSEAGAGPLTNHRDNSRLRLPFAVD